MKTARLHLARRVLTGSIASVCAAALFASSGAQAASLYWDTNGTGAAGSGAATGTWGSSVFWSTDSTGANVGSPVLTDVTSAADDLFFSAGTNGTTGIVTIGTTQSAHSITFDDPVALTLSGGTAINLGSGTAGSGLFFTGNAANTISTAITLNSAATTVSITNNTASLQTIGAITGATGATQTITAGSTSTGGITLSGAIDDGGGTVALTVNNTSTGVTNLTAANTYTGATAISRGTLNLGGGGAAGSLASTVLNLGGGTLSYTRTGTNTQALTTTNFTAGANAVSTTATNTLTLGSLVRSVGGTVNFGSTGTITTSTANDATGILGGWATVNNDNWAVANGAGSAITALATYTLGNATASTYTNANIDVANATVGGVINANSLRFSGASTKTLTLAAGDNIIQSGGILVRSDVAANASTISGGNLLGSSGGDLIVHQHNATTALTINSIIKDNATATALTKSGAGQLVLTGVNIYTGNTYINAGTLTIGSNGGTATLGPATYAGDIFIAGGASLIFDTGSSQTLSGVISGDGTLRKSAGGTLTLSGNNTYTGKTTVSCIGAGGATLSISSFNSVVGGTASSSLGAPTTVANGTIDLGSGTNTRSNTLIYTGSGETTDRVMNIAFNGTSSQTIQADVTGGGLLKFTSAFTQTGSSSGALILSGSGNAEITQAIPTLGGTGGLSKQGAGTWTLSGSSAYTNTTTIAGGTLTINSSAGIGNGSATNTLIFNGGTLQAGGTITSPSTRGVTMTGAGTINTNGNAVSIAGIIGGTGALTKSGASTLTLSNANTFTGSTTVSNGKVIMTNALALQNSAYNTTGSNGSTIGLDATSALNSGTLTLGGLSGAVNLASAFTAGYTGSVTNLTLNPQTGITSSYSGIIANGSGAMTLTKTGAGTQQLSGTNTFTGGTFLNAGTLDLQGNAASLGTLQSDRTLTVTGTSTLTGLNSNTYNLGALTVNAGFGLTIDNSTSKTFTFTTTTGSNTATITHTGNGNGTLNLGNATAYTGTLNSNAGSSSSGNVTFSSLGDATGAGRLVNNGTVGGTGNFTLTGNVGPLTFDTGGRQVGFSNTASAQTLGLINNNTTAANAWIINTDVAAGSAAATRTLAFDGSNTGANAFNGTIGNTSGGGVVSVSKAGAGNWTLSGDNTFTGSVTVNAGALTLSGVNQYTGQTTFGGTGTLIFNSIKNYSVASSLGKPASGDITISNFGPATLIYVGSGDTSNRTISYTGDVSTRNQNSGIYNNGTGALIFNATTFNTSITGNGGRTNNLILGGSYNGSANQITGTIQDNVTGALISITKAADASTWNLAGANTYTGATTISGGVLSVSSLANAAASSNLGAFATAGATGISLNGGTLQYTGASGVSVNRGFTLAATSTVDISPASTTLTLGASSLGAFTLNVTGGAGSSLGLGATALTGAATLNPTTANLIVASFSGTQNLTLGGTSTGNTVTGVIGTSTGTLTKTGTGTWSLTGANTYTGTTTVSRGILDLGGGTANGTIASTVLTLNGGAFNYTRTGSTTQGFTTTNINAGTAGAISVVSGNILNLGTVARGAGGSFDFSTAGAGTVAALAASNTVGMMRGLTFGDTWAVANGAGVAISGLATFTQSSTAGNTAANYANLNIDVNSSQTPAALITPNSLRFNTAAANTLTLTGTNTVTSGILIGSAVGNNLSTITGGTLTSAASSDLAIVQNNTDNSLTIGSIIANNTATSLTKSGAGLLTLTAANTYSGLTSVNAGTLAMSGGNTTSGTATVGSAGNSATLNISAGTYTFGAASQISVGNSGTGTVNQTGGTVTITQGIGELLVGNGLGGTGTYTLSAGSINHAGAATTVRGVMIGVNDGSTGTFNLSGTGSLNLVTAQAALMVGRSDTTLTAATSATYNQTGGTATVQTLTIGGNSTNGSPSGTSTFSVTGGTFNANTFTHLAGGSSNTAAITIGGAGQATLPAFPTARGTGSTATLTLDSTTGFLSPSAASASYMPAGTFTNAYLTANGANFNVPTAKDITVGQVLKNNIAENGTLTKSGVGALTLTGANLYTGATTISGGTLSVNGSLANSATTVQANAFLKGSGSILGAVTVQNLGTIAAGNSIESLATGALTLDAGSTFAFELDDDAVANLSGDLTAVTGNLTIAPTNDALLTLTELGAGSWASEKLTLISYSGTWNGGLLDYLGADILDDSTITLGGDTWLFNYNDTTKGDNYTADATGTSFVTMTVQPVPEPHTALLAGLGLLALLRRRRN